MLSRGFHLKQKILTVLSRKEEALLYWIIPWRIRNTKKVEISNWAGIQVFSSFFDIKFFWCNHELKKIFDLVHSYLCDNKLDISQPYSVECQMHRKIEYRKINSKYISTDRYLPVGMGRVHFSGLEFGFGFWYLAQVRFWLKLTIHFWLKMHAMHNNLHTLSFDRFDYPKMSAL